MNYDIHVGAIGGIEGKIIAFLSSLIVGSLPITGTMIWWGRRKSSSPKSGSKTKYRPPLKRRLNGHSNGSPKRKKRKTQVATEPVE